MKPVEVVHENSNVIKGITKKRATTASHKESLLFKKINEAKAKYFKNPGENGGSHSPESPIHLNKANLNGRSFLGV